MWRWVVALCLSCAVYVTLYYANEEVRAFVVRVVYSTDDFLYVQWFEAPQTILTSAPQSASSFTAVQRFADGFLASYTETQTLLAREAGVVIFTGYTTDIGQMLTVAYRSGVTVTLGQLDALYELPYSAVRRGDVLALKYAGELYVRIEQDGHVYTLEETLAWLGNG